MDVADPGCFRRGHERLFEKSAAADRVEPEVYENSDLCDRQCRDEAVEIATLVSDRDDSARHAARRS
jgi:hypothetical protein